MNFLTTFWWYNNPDVLFQGQFGVDQEELLRCLICTMSVTRGESIRRFHNLQQAEGGVYLVLI